MSRNVTAADIASAAVLLFTALCLATPFLRKSRNSECQQEREGSNDNLHGRLSISFSKVNLAST
jgi:hypothetical protein